MKRYSLLLMLAWFARCQSLLASELEATSYLEEAISLMEKVSVRRSHIDWKALRKSAYNIAQGAKCPKDTYEAIRHALTLLEDYHSLFLTPEQVEYWFSDKLFQESLEGVKSRLIDTRIGYISIPGFTTVSAQQEFARTIQTHIQALDDHKLDKWIVDLRNDTGGSVWPMVLGLRPLIGEGIVGYFSDGFTAPQVWHFKDNAVYVDAEEACSLDIPSYQLHHRNPSIAVLVGPSTASAGEATTISFLGKDNVRLFGQKTSGLTSGNEEFIMSDGAIIAIASTYEADRTGRLYQDVIIPDVELIDDDANITLQAAIDWLQEAESHLCVN